ncbi:hypothetical protein MASR1M12_22230 [Erysipelotrichia bacterium]
MPGFDRTGPNGQGPMTGCGMGCCQAVDQTGRMPVGRRGGCGFGRGGGRGRGLRQGFGPAAGRGRYRNIETGYEQVEPVDIEERGDGRIEMQNQIDSLKVQLVEIKDLLTARATEKITEKKEK